jgi:predicted transcriptional regulator
VNFKQAVQKQRKKTVIPKGWSTVAMIAKELGVSHVRASNILKPMRLNGVVERQRITSYTPEGTGSLAYVYRVIKK